MAKVIHYYFNAYGYNFGDALGAEIVQRLSSGRALSVDLVRNSRTFNRLRPSGLFGLGSIFDLVSDGDVVWGTGINPSVQDACTKLYSKVSIVAVRGPLTRRYLTERLGVSCPEIYGDPALLLPRLLPGAQARPVRRYGVIPHHFDKPLVDHLKDLCLREHRRWTTASRKE